MMLLLVGFINTLKQELDDTRVNQETNNDEMSVVNAHLNELLVKFSVRVNKGQDKLPTVLVILAASKRPYKCRFIANPCSGTNTEFSKLSIIGSLLLKDLF